ncbi:MAG: TlpA family protein disulfide reductase [Chitinophagaceae bacterium]|nr:TlpA family protein disulfide reductase [Chitinophagaceae bacterium]
MKIYLLLFFTLIGFSLTAQSVKKVSIGELETYIKQSKNPLVISFWATWCGPCVREIPWLESEVAKKKSDSVELILVSLDFPEDYPKKINSFITQKKFNATHFWLNETNADIFCPPIDPRWSGSIPANLFINNRTGYRQFFQRQLTDRQVEIEVGKVVKG